MRFGVFELDLKSGELRRGGVLVRLQPQPFKALAFLASRPRQMVTREELQQEIWGDDINVDFEQGLNHCIKQVRDALGDDADAPRFIETLPKRGYRFIAPVEKVGVSPLRGERADEEPTPVLRPPRRLRWQVALAGLAVVAVLAYLSCRLWPGLCPWPPEAEKKTMLVVLPFENLSGDPQQEYFSDGLTEEMITQLGRLQPDRLGVIARTTAMRFKHTNKKARDIGRELRVNYILEGSVRRGSDHLRISVQLIQASDETHLWAENYERAQEDVLIVQSDVARRVADALALKLLPAQQTVLAHAQPVNPQAYEAYLQGRYQWNKRDPEALRKSIDFFQEAIKADPSYARAYAGLADAYGLLGSAPYDAIPAHEAMPKAKAAAMQALALDDHLAEAHTALAHAKLYYDWDWETAGREFERAIELDPSYATARQWYAEYLWTTGRPDQALQQIRRAMELDPYSLVVHLTLGRHFYVTRQYDQAIASFQDTIEMEPAFFLGHFDLGMAYVQVGRHAEAIQEFQQAVTLSGNSPLCQAGLGYAYAKAGKATDARRVLSQLERLSKQRPVSALYFAGIYAGLGDKDQALRWLDRAYQERSTYLVHLGIEPTFDTLHDDPRFRELLRRLGLPTDS